MRLSYELRWEIRWARDRQRRRILRAEAAIARELDELRQFEREKQARARAVREAAWLASLPVLLAEWRLAEGL